MNRGRHIVIGGLLIAMLLLVMRWQNSVPNQSTTPAENPANDGNGTVGKLTPAGVGVPQSPLAKKTFWVPFAGNITLGARTERSNINIANGKSVDLDVTTFFDQDGRVARVEYSKNKGWKRKWTNEETESVYESQGETIHGLYSGPLTIKWEELFKFLRGYVDLAAAAHFDITRVEYGYGTAHLEVFVCNIYCARGMFDPELGDDDSKKVRILIIPSRNHAMVDDVL